ncbi:hypothetical protein ACYJ1Y_00660 [Natrialbaceae archaeon A-gly3]
MRLSIPGIPGVYYDTDARSNVLTLALTAAGRGVPKPQGYAVQLFPYVWSFEVDLREVPNDHPLQYLHPEGAYSIEGLTHDDLSGELGRDLEATLRLALRVEEETELALEEFLGIAETEEGIVIEIDDGAAAELEGTEGDLEDVETNREVTEIDFEEDETDEDSGVDEFRPDEFD